MEPGVLRSELGRQTTRVAELLVAATPDGLAAPVPGCPGWTLADLAAHLGGVHRWAAAACRGTDDPGEQPAGPEDPAALAGWYAAGAGELLAELDAGPPERACWTFAEPATVGFWLRRQLHETSVHRLDAEVALGRRAGLDAAVALDGLDEVASMILPRQLRLGRLAVGPEVVTLDPGVGPAVRLDRGSDAPPAATVAGSPADLLLLVWRRTGLDDPALTVSGDRAVAERLLALPITP